MTPEEIRQHMEMQRLYRQQVLKEQPTIQIQGLRRPSKQMSRKWRTRTSSSRDSGLPPPRLRRYGETS